MQAIVCAGLCGKGPWTDFLIKGLYDPRLLLKICAWVLDTNYIIVSGKEEFAQHGYNKFYHGKYKAMMHFLLEKNRSRWDDPPDLSQIPECYKTRSFYLAYAKKYSTYGIPEEYKTYKFFLDLGKHYNYSLRDVPEKFRNLYMCKVYVRHSWKNIRFVPGNLCNREIKELALKNNIRAVMEVPVSDERLYAAFKKNYRIIEFMYYFSDDMGEYVRENCSPKAIKFLPKQYQTYEFCKRAVMKQPKNIQYVRKDLMDLELCEIAFAKSKKLIWYFPYIFITVAMRNAIQEDRRISADIRRYALTGIKMIF